MAAETIFLGCGFAAKYRLGGGNFSVPLQWALGLKKLGRDFIWLEHLPATKEGPDYDRACLRTFADRMRQHGLEGRWCVLYQNPQADEHDFKTMRFYGKSRAEIEARLAGPNVLLNLSYSLHPALLERFERRIFCDLDPTEISYWMSQGLEMGQSHHHEFWTIGLNMGAADCQMPTNGLRWQTFFPLVDPALHAVRPPPRVPRFTTIGQWYWVNNIVVENGWVDRSKGAKFQPFLELPRQLPGIELELAMNFAAGDGEPERLRALGWRVVEPHDVARSPWAYRRYLASASGEFTTIKGVDCLWRSGWMSDRAVAFLATGRPVVTEDAGVSRHLPPDSGFFEIRTPDEARETLARVVRDWPALSRRARATAEEFCDASRTLRRMLG
ncbi:MAG: hypothetical protein JO295_15055 [Verrucomicrobia bacterium]|nr:hypothetical protein [Verrucomicrobiota bacterium]